MDFSRFIWTEAILLQMMMMMMMMMISMLVSSHPIPPPKNATSNGSGWDSFRNFAGCQLGDHVDGLSSLKQYFKQFGYIPDSPPSSSSNSNFSDDFDDSFENAIKTYQRNFNLNATGFLDNSTIGHMVRPRCGVADVINGTSSMNSGAAEGRKLYSFFPGTPSWPSYKRELTYAISTENLMVDIDTMRSICSRAFARWAEVTTLNFTETDSYSSADLKIAFFSGDHGDGEPFDGPLGTLAHSFSPTNGRFHLDAAEDWIADGDVTTSSSSSAIDLESVAVHEIGHLLGLGHSSVEDAIMYPTLEARTRKVELANDDINGIQQLYGSNPNYNGSSSLSSEDKDLSSSSCGRMVGLFGGSFHILLALGWMLLFHC